jgi:hypothetical protein
MPEQNVRSSPPTVDHYFGYDFGACLRGTLTLVAEPSGAQTVRAAPVAVGEPANSRWEAPRPRPAGGARAPCVLK